MNKLKALRILQLNDNYTEEDLKSSFRRLSFQKHPDRFNNSSKATEEFREVREAYEYLLLQLKKKEEESQTDWVVAVTSKMAEPEFTPVFRLFGEVGITLQQMAGVFSSTAKQKGKK